GHGGSRMNHRFDAIVIGSGFGGAVTACRLAEQGYSVCVLERGQGHFHPPGYDRYFADSVFTLTEQGVWNESAGKYGVTEYMSFPNLHLLRASGVGGGSLHYYGATLRPLRHHFERLAWPTGVTWGLLDGFYSTAERMLRAVPVSPTPANPALPPRTQAFGQAMQLAGEESFPVPLAINFGQVPERPVCDHRGDCGLGCNISAKNTLDTNYLSWAVANGAVIWPLCKATCIEPRGAQGYRVYFHRLNDHCDLAIDADRVIVSASSIGSTELLLRCKYVHRTLDMISPALGCNFTTNGDYAYSGTLLPRGIPVCPTQGPNITAAAWFEEGHDQFLVEDCSVSDELRILLRKTILRRTSFLPILQSYMQGEFPIEFEWTNEIQKTWGRINRFLPYLVMGQDPRTGQISLDSCGNACIDWPYEATWDFFEKVRNVLRRISCATGGEYFENVWEQNGKSFTAHALGGCIMGDSMHNAVVDARGEVFNYPNLHVIDGSIIPGPIGVNPSLTITAVAELINYML
ncbi:MAG: GMC oxidoreductase, partial [Pirellulaceae bacterium]